MMPESTHCSNAQKLGAVANGPNANDVSGAGLGAPLVVGGHVLPNRVFMAPLSGISDVPFRRLARRFGAGMVFSEMVASGQFVSGCDESALRAMRDGDGLHAVQLAGRDPQWMKEAARRLADTGVDLIDINMGCPAKKVVGGQSGSALMREPDLALRLVEATVAGVGSVPVTLKMRLGWDHRSVNAPELAAMAEAVGVRMITVHGRTRRQFYEGRADWSAIGAVRRRIAIPLVANGDLVAADQMVPMRAASRADALMVGRGAQGRPWLPAYLAGHCTDETLARYSLFDLVEEHYTAMLAHYGRDLGLRQARKHLGWYLDRFAAMAGQLVRTDRTAIMTGTDPVAIANRLKSLFSATTLLDVESTATVAKHQLDEAA